MKPVRSVFPGQSITGFKALQRFALLMCVLLVTACASTGSGTSSDAGAGGEEAAEAESASAQPVVDNRDEVVQRAEARWAALLDRDQETAYTYYSPGYRSTTSVFDFMFKERTRRVRWISAEYIDHDCSGDSCKVRFKGGFEVRKPVPGMDIYNGFEQIEESWVRTEGEWWYVPPR